MNIITRVLALAVSLALAPQVIAQADPDVVAKYETRVVLACSPLLSDNETLRVVWERAKLGEDVVLGYLVSAFGASEYAFSKVPDGGLIGVSVEDDNYQVQISSTLHLTQYNFQTADEDGLTEPNALWSCREMSGDEIRELIAEDRLP